MTLIIEPTGRARPKRLNARCLRLAPDETAADMTGMSPAEYVNEIVMPTVREFRDERRSRQRAYLACIAIFHVKDHLARAKVKDVETAMRVNEPRAFDVVRAVCNGTKHVEADASHPIPFRVGDDWDRPPAFAGVMECGISRLGDPVGGREVAAGSDRLGLYACVRATLAAFKANFPAHLGGCDLSDL